MVISKKLKSLNKKSKILNKKSKILKRKNRKNRITKINKYSKKIKNLKGGAAPPNGILQPLAGSKYDFFEKQESAGCGRHALNNLLGGTYFIKGKLTDSQYTEDEIKNVGLNLSEAKPVNLSKLCKYIAGNTNLALTGTNNYCEESENYDISVLTLGLQVCGFNTENKSGQLFIEEEETDKIKLLGYIINYGGGHWVALKYLNKKYSLVNSTTYTYDSVKNKHDAYINIFNTISEYKKNIDTRNLVNVFIVENRYKQIDIEMLDEVTIKEIEKRNAEIEKRKNEFQNNKKNKIQSTDLNPEMINLIEYYYENVEDTDLLNTIIDKNNILLNIQNKLLEVKNVDSSKKLSLTPYDEFVKYFKLVSVQSPISNIGWGFDGVLHLEVTPLVNNNDSRHPCDNNFESKGHTVQNHKLFDELFQKVIIPLNKFNQCIITANTQLDVIKNYKYEEHKFDKIFKYGIIKSSNKINDLQTKKINYFFDDSNSNIINIYNLWYKGGLSDLQKLYKVIPESIYDIYDHKNNHSDANGTLNPPIVQILKTNENIKILTYNIKYNLNDKSADNVHAILKKTIEVDKVDFICLQEFGYVDTKLYVIKGIQQKFKDTNNITHDSVTFDYETSNKNPFNKLNIKAKSIINNTNYSYVYNIQNPEMQFTFYDKNKYTIKKDKDNKDLIIRGTTSFYTRPFTLIVFINISSNENLILINVHLPHKKNKNKKIMNNDFINRRIIDNINKNNSINATILNYLKKSRVIVAGDFNRTIYSNKKNTNYYSNNSENGSIKDYRDNITLSDHKIDNSAYGLKLFGPSSIDKQILDKKNTNESLNSLINKNNSNDNFKSLIMYNIPINNTTFKKTTCSNLGHIDNVLDSFGLQFKYEYDDNKNASDHIPVLVTLLAAKPVYDLSELQNELINGTISGTSQIPQNLSKPINLCYT